jgi:hypothetical protein
MKKFWNAVKLTALAFVVLSFASQRAVSQGPSQCNVSTAAPTYGNGQTRALSCDTQGNVRTTASVSASIAGFNPTTTGTPISVTTGGDTGNLPAGAVVVAFNVGTTNTAYCKLGAAATVNDIPLVAGGGWFAFTVGAETQLTCITSTSTTTVNMIGGTGLATGAVGGGGGGSGGTVDQGTGGVSAWLVTGTGGTFPATQSGTWTVQPGNTANTTAWLVTGTGGTFPATQSGAWTVAATQSGSWSLAANQSVNVAQINGVTPLMGAGNTGTGSPRVTIATDQAAIAAAGQGATGAAAPAGATLAGARSGANMVGLIQASASAAITMSTATTTQFVALSGGTSIYITSFDFIAAGTTNVTLVYGTGSNCGTGTTSLTGAYTLTAQAGVAKGNGLGPVLVVPAGNAFCVTNSQAVVIGGSISYTQF